MSDPTNPAAQSGDPLDILSAPPTSLPKAQAPGEKKKKPILTIVLAGVIVLAVGFAGGFFTGRGTASKNTASTGMPGNFAARMGARGGLPSGAASAFPGGNASGAANMSRAAGQITAIDGDTITIKTTEGTTVKVTTSSDTKVSEITSGATSDLKVGDQITAAGTGSDTAGITASTITSGDETSLMGGFGGGFGRGGMPSDMPSGGGQMPNAGGGAAGNGQ
ncbi:MAG: hypothetical protein LBM66_01625 [Bifidobacteriaceae bacterium]|jgi:hypothetical protein|nr:hypothetical protein [Bifidobacteriaceae bacterium]